MSREEMTTLIDDIAIAALAIHGVKCIPNGRRAPIN
jgi:hypothetical protein